VPAGGFLCLPIEWRRGAANAHYPTNKQNRKKSGNEMKMKSNIGAAPSITAACETIDIHTSPRWEKQLHMSYSIPGSIDSIFIFPFSALSPPEMLVLLFN